MIGNLSSTDVRAGVYTRLSRDPQGTKPNIAGQERRCRELIETRGWQVGEAPIRMGWPIGER